jgi:hypothetical protein
MCKPKGSAQRVGGAEMMDFYSMEKIAFAKLTEDHETAACAHRAAAAAALRRAAQGKTPSLLGSFINSMARVLPLRDRAAVARNAISVS